ncbi:MAG: cyclodeaminase/cyclohydrolase family protein, partial [Thaumarchaeota archaeon]|nr:cyclodeaminase/cyclohydrolase family protein [Nitrososphaerota archaeon]
IREIGNKNTMSDAETAIQLAKAAILGAWSNVQVNLESLDDQEFFEKKKRELRPMVDEIKYS